MCFFFKRCRNKPPVVHASRHNIQITQSFISIRSEFEVKEGDITTMFSSAEGYGINAAQFSKMDISLNNGVHERVVRGEHIMTSISAPGGSRIIIS